VASFSGFLKIQGQLAQAAARSWWECGKGSGLDPSKRSLNSSRAPSPLQAPPGRRMGATARGGRFASGLLVRAADRFKPLPGPWARSWSAGNGPKRGGGGHGERIRKARMSS